MPFGAIVGQAAAQQFRYSSLLKLMRYCEQSYHCLIKNPSLFLMRKVGRFELVRNAICRLSQNPERSLQLFYNSPSIFKDLNVEEVVSALKTDGLYAGLELPQNIVEDVQQYAMNTPCYGNRDENLPFLFAEKGQAEAKFQKVFRCASYPTLPQPSIQKVVYDPGLLAIATAYLGAVPVYVASELLWSFPVETTWDEQIQMAQVFHYDLDDYRSIKFFFYLTDVGLTSGPHASIRGTHKNKRLIHQLLGQRCASIPDHQIVSDYGAENVVTLVGDAGFGFVEDSCCFHKGSLPTERARLMLQVEFSINYYDNIRSFK